MDYAIEPPTCDVCGCYDHGNCCDTVRRVRTASAECYDEPAPFGNLVDVNTKETIRPATQAEESKSLARAAREGWPGVIIVENRACFVD